MVNEEIFDKYLTPEEFSTSDDFENVSEFGFDEIVDQPDPQLNLNDDNSSQQSNNDVLTLLLKEKGISDPTQLKFENENGEEEKISFYDLSAEEQLEIIKNQNDSQTDLDDKEIDFINYLRNNQLTPDELINHVKTQAIQEYLSNQQPLESVESMTDDEIFLTDLLTRIKDITDEEAKEALEFEKQNETLFKKKVDALRADFIEKETLRKQEEYEIAEEEKKQSYEAFKQSLFNTAPSVKEIAGRIELDDEDINDTVDFLLAEDATGTRYIAKALNDPASLIKMAWFYIKGEEAIGTMADYYENQIKQYAETNYQKGYEDGKNGSAPTRRVAVKPKEERNIVSNFTTIPKNPALQNQ